MRKMYALLCVVLAGTLAHAQHPFIKQLPLTHGQHVSATSDGGYLVAGSNFVIKYSATDAVVFTVSVIDTTKMELVKVLPTRDNGYIVLANSIAGGVERPQICKLDASGFVMWRKAIFGDEAGDIAEDYSGNFVVAYYNNGDVTTSRFIKVDNKGNILWSQSLSFSSGDTYISSIQVTKDNHYAVAGAVNELTNFSIFDSTGRQVVNKTFNYVPYKPVLNQFSNGDFLLVTNQNNYGATAYVTRLTKKGRIVWQKIVGGNDQYDNFNSTIISGSTITLAGYRTNSEFADTVLTVASMQTDGTFTGEKTITTPEPVAAVSAAKLNDGSYVVLGGRFTYSFARNRHNNSYLIRLNAAGNTCNTSTIATTSTDNNLDTAASSYYAPYHLNTVSPAISFTTTSDLKGKVICNAAADIIADASSKTIAAIAGQLTGFVSAVYPNPAVNTLFVQINMQQGGNVKAMLTDLQGKTMLQQSYTLSKSTTTKNINVSSLAPGIYLLQVNSNTAAKTIKIIKE